MPKAIPRRCGTCRFLDVQPDKLGRIIPRADTNYRCLAPDPALPVLPPMSDAFKSGTDHNWAVSYGKPQVRRASMWIDDGTTCETYEVAARNLKPSKEPAA